MSLPEGDDEDASEETLRLAQAMLQQVFVVEHGLTPGGRVATAQAWAAFLDFAGRPVLHRDRQPSNEWTQVSHGGQWDAEGGEPQPSITLDRLITVEDDEGWHDGEVRCMCDLTFDDARAFHLVQTLTFEGPGGETPPAWVAEARDANEFMTVEDLAAAVMASEIGPLLRLPECVLRIDARHV